MKKGELTVQMIVKFLPHLFITIVLIAVIVSAIYSFSSSQSVEQKDFDRIVADANQIIAKQELSSVITPLSSEGVFDIVLYPQSQAPRACQKQVCLCLYDVSSGTQVDCKRLENVGSVCQGCGKVCVGQVQRFVIEPNAHRAIISRGCNDIAIA